MTQTIFLQHLQKGLLKPRNSSHTKNCASAEFKPAAIEFLVQCYNNLAESIPFISIFLFVYLFILGTSIIISLYFLIIRYQQKNVVVTIKLQTMRSK